jgi:hypothetical protein
MVIRTPYFAPPLCVCAGYGSGSGSASGVLSGRLEGGGEGGGEGRQRHLGTGPSGSTTLTGETSPKTQSAQLSQLEQRLAREREQLELKRREVGRATCSLSCCLFVCLVVAWMI